MLDECFFSFRFKAQNRSSFLALAQELASYERKVVAAGSEFGVFRSVFGAKGIIGRLRPTVQSLEKPSP